MKMKRNSFDSMEAFEAYTDVHGSIEPNTVTIVREERKNGKWMCIDLSTDCKRAKTSARRMFSVLTYEEVHHELNWRLEDVEELIENGCFELHEDGEFSFGCEEIDEGIWYIHLNVRTEPSEEEVEEAVIEEVAEEIEQMKKEADVRDCLALADGKKVRLVEWQNGTTIYEGLNPSPTWYNFEVESTEADTDTFYIYVNEGQTVSTTDEMVRIEETYSEYITELSDWSDDAVICDAIDELADLRTSIYYSDIIKYIGNNVEAVNDVIKEYGWEGCGSDLYKAGQMAEYEAIRSNLCTNEEEVIEGIALDYLRNTFGEHLPKWLWEEIKKEIECIDLNCTIGEIRDSVDKVVGRNERIL